MSKKNILLIGADGFIGEVLRTGLLEQGYQVFSTVFVRAAGANELRLDISKASEFDKLPNIAFDAVINNAGVVDQSMPAKLMFAVNAEGVRHATDWAKRTGCQHFIQISSIGVYGLRAMGQNRDEQSTPRTRLLGVPYQTSKAKGERYVEASGMPYTMLRLPAVLGRGDTVVSPAVASTLAAGSFFHCGSGNPGFSLIYVNNLPDIVAGVIEKGPANTVYNCSSHDITWNELVDEYARVLKVAVPTTRKSVLTMITRMSDKLYLFVLTNSRFGSHFPSDKLFKAYDYVPAYDWRQGVTEAAEDYL
jgi:nucleoside-diphosphate-sugar epimerase